ncbi:MAG: zinc-binding alcohol dehydrogenase family protein [Sphingomonadales bacterium]
MRTEAFVLKAFGEAQQAFALQNVDIEPLEPDEVLISSEAFGLNYADVMARLGLYREAPPRPCVLGYELVGRITEVGSVIDPSWIGRRVLAVTRFGAYAKQAKTRINAVVDIGNMSAAEALPFATQGVTAHYMAEVLSPIQAHDNVLIHAAAGGVGSFLVQLAKLKGATVFGKIGKADKKDYLLSLGVDFPINYKEEPYTQQIQTVLRSEKLSVSFNAVGGRTAKQDLQMLGPGGRLFLFGGADLGTRKGLFGKLSFLWEMGLILPVGLMMQSKSLLGVNMLKIADEQPLVIQHSMQQMLELYAQGKIILPHINCFSQSKFYDAHEALGNGTTTGKVVVIWD